MNTTMKAVTSRIYGGPEVMKLEEVERPTPKSGEVLIKVAASSVNPYDWHFLRGSPFFIRLVESGFLKPKNPILGADVSGTIAAVGPGVTAFKVGDDVFGDIGAGAFAQYAVAPVKKSVPKPKSIPHIETGVIGIAGLTALQAVREWGQVRRGQSVLINGASGGVGVYAVQIAKYLGAEVTGVCSGRNVDMVRDIGADHVIDYQRQDFTERANKYDVIIDLAANRSIKEIKQAMAERSVWVHVGFNFKNMAIGGLFGRWLFSDTGKDFVLKVAEVNQADLQTLGELLAEVHIKSVIDRSYELQDTAIAIEYIETMRARGKVAIRVE
jgi:NADPH:quinone reductase-like Zn-dependent oxidoreductase